MLVFASIPDTVITVTPSWRGYPCTVRPEAAKGKKKKKHVSKERKSYRKTNMAWLSAAQAFQGGGEIPNFGIQNPFCVLLFVFPNVKTSSSIPP